MRSMIFGRKTRRASEPGQCDGAALSGLDAHEEHLRSRFDSIAPFTVGAEEEFMLIDPETLALLPGAERVLAIAEGDTRLTGELRASQIETISPICVSVPDLLRELASVRGLLAGRLGDSAWLLAAGTHPLAVEPGPLATGRRYQELAFAHPWAATHTLTCGFHVHVAVGGADRTLAVYNSLRNYLPEFVALAANAPFYRGEDSGLATARPKLNGCWPRVGVPPAFSSWRDLAQFTLWARDGGAFPDESQHWWDLRLNTRHGTIEVRAPDVQTRVEDAATLAALIQSVVVALATRYDAGEDLPVARDERIVENMWLATRDGVGGWLIDLETGERLFTGDRLVALVEELFETARSIGCERELAGVRRLVMDGGGAARQRELYDEDGPQSLVTALAHETVTPVAVGQRDQQGASVRRAVSSAMLDSTVLTRGD